MNELLIVCLLVNVFLIVSCFLIVRKGKVTFASGLTLFLTFALMSKFTDMYDFSNGVWALFSILFLGYFFIVSLIVSRINDRFFSRKQD